MSTQPGGRLIFRHVGDPHGPGGCVICGDERAESKASPKLYCCPSHRDKARRVRNGTLAGPLPAVRPGLCLWCAKPLEQATVRARVCAKPGCAKALTRVGFAGFRKACVWPHPLAWLGPKVGLPGNDSRLPGVALRLALAEELVVYVRRDGTVGEVGKPKPPRRQKERRS